MPLDIKIFYLFNNLAGKSWFFDSSVIFFADYLEYFVAAFFIAVLFSSAFYKEKLKVFLIAVTSVVLSRFIITEIIRFFYHRLRPFLTLPVHQLIADNEYSFPSGHAAFFFALATAVYFYNKKWGLAFFAAAILMTLARVVAGVHYPSDILGGAIIGILSAWVVFYFAKKYEK